jgi:hypothetical protein
MPKIDGQDFPPYTYQEFPKTLYAGGAIDGETRVVESAPEEAEAVAEGFVSIVPEAPADADLEFPEPPAGSAVDSDPNHVLVDSGEPDDDTFVASVEVPPADDAFNGADPAEFNHDGDGKPGGSKARKAK